MHPRHFLTISKLLNSTRDLDLILPIIFSENFQLQNILMKEAENFEPSNFSEKNNSDQIFCADF